MGGMSQKLVLLCLACLSVLFDACANRNGAWESQYLAARSLGDLRQRDESLAAAAESAAAIDDLATVKKALGDLDGRPNHDAVAERCAIQLGNAGHPFDAREVARLVQDPDLRRLALFKVGGQ
jgi:hypothetical protein